MKRTVGCLMLIQRVSCCNGQMNIGHGHGHSSLVGAYPRKEAWIKSLRQLAYPLRWYLSRPSIHKRYYRPHGMQALSYLHTPDNKDYPKLGVMLVPFEDFKAWTLSKMPIK
ncbi:hypothetical protein M431DRAFT_498843 [Trichoderma harzianum CBS 226.95]|uniref:Uncharacterized protein n=1 Tax=Trichoderma harzianum CBS 226.95 TaxID=983964 RepID=A0A2T4A0X9_TRIHA|nr:hypothetical protein M431DRAFT_498843 [Trichoderma harzianum CBS 226.95]PTB50716.1 hypothetical protein M431DRAFT_498843 [Trichoderma harzianum CBS 226.95]